MAEPTPELISVIGRRRVPAPVARRDHDEQHALVNDGASPPLGGGPEFSLAEVTVGRVRARSFSARMDGPPKRKFMPALIS